VGKKGKADKGRRMQVNYKDVGVMQRLMSRQGRLFSRKRSGLDSQAQRRLKIAVKRARFMGLLPYMGS
jgi:small subunit ribosomal protein S18